MRPLSMGPLTAAQQAFAADPRHLAVARDEAWRWAGSFPRYADEVESAAHWGLVTAARTWRPGVCRAEHHVRLRVRYAIKDALREEFPCGFRRAPQRTRRAPGVVHIPAVTPRDGENALAWDGWPSDDLPVGWELESEDAVARLTAGVGPGGAVLRALYLRADCDGTQERAGRACGLREANTSVHVKNAMREIRGRAKGGVT